MNRFFTAALAACLLGLAMPAPAQTPAQSAYLKAESARIQQAYVRQIARVTGMGDAQIRRAVPAEGRITDPAARVIAALEKERGEPLPETLRQAIVQADLERKSALAAARETARQR